MKPATILVAEDDAHIREGLIDALSSEGYRALEARNGVEAIELCHREKPDLLILDIMMPGKSGYQVCRELRSRDTSTLILILTAKGEEVDKVVGLELGADDYMTKPFGVRELLARVSALLRRKNRGDTPTDKEAVKPFRFGAAEVDPRKLLARRSRKEYSITAREVQLMDYFRAHPGDALTRDEILNAAWGIDYMGTTRTLDQHIAQLRKKIEINPSNPTVICTVHGVGYRYMP